MTDLDKIRENEGQYSDHHSNNDAWHEYGLVSKPKPRASGVKLYALGMMLVLAWIVIFGLVVA